MSSGSITGDGPQAGYWKRNSSPNNPIGIMDPTITFGELVPADLSDDRIFDLVGYNFIPELSNYLLLYEAAALVKKRKRPISC